jgi:hypothetical protein
MTARPLSRSQAKQKQKPAVYKVTVGHDPGCPCLAGQPLTACTCKSVDLVGRRVA